MSPGGACLSLSLRERPPSLVLVTRLSAAPTCLEPDWQLLPGCPLCSAGQGSSFLEEGSWHHLPPSLPRPKFLMREEDKDSKVTDMQCHLHLS